MLGLFVCEYTSHNPCLAFCICWFLVVFASQEQPGKTHTEIKPGSQESETILSHEKSTLRRINNQVQQG